MTKAWRISNCDYKQVICFAETAGKAKAIALSVFWDFDEFTELGVRREPAADKLSITYVTHIPISDRQTYEELGWVFYDAK